MRSVRCSVHVEAKLEIVDPHVDIVWGPAMWEDIGLPRYPRSVLIDITGLSGPVRLNRKVYICSATSKDILFVFFSCSDDDTHSGSGSPRTIMWPRTHGQAPGPSPSATSTIYHSPNQGCDQECNSFQWHGLQSTFDCCD